MLEAGFASPHVAQDFMLRFELNAAAAEAVGLLADSIAPAPPPESTVPGGRCAAAPFFPPRLHDVLARAPFLPFRVALLLPLRRTQ